ncbi:MAG: heme exporter protein CcmB [Acidobacteria bacterium]|nr:heme exporter protein CcmB [Acidobacteriota bacterium]
MHYLRAVATIALKDLRSEFRSKEAINASLSFAMVVLLLLSFAFDPSSEQAREFSGGLLWLVFAFAGTLILNRSFARELGNDCLDALLASPLPSWALYVGKCISNWLLLMALELACLPVFGIFYSIDWTVRFDGLLLVIGLATWALTVIGTMFSALTVNLRLRELMLPILVYPMMIPALLGAIQLTTDLLAGRPLSADNMLWLRLLVGFDVIYTALAVALVDTVLIG